MKLKVPQPRTPIPPEEAYFVAIAYLCGKNNIYNNHNSQIRKAIDLGWRNIIFGNILPQRAQRFRVHLSENYDGLRTRYNEHTKTLEVIFHGKA